MESMKKILILCVGYPFHGDSGFGYHVFQALRKMDLPEDVEILEVGESASEFDFLIDGRDKMFVVDAFRTQDPCGTIVQLEASEVPMTVDGVTDLGKYHLLDTLDQIQMSGHCPETIFIGVVPKDFETMTPEPTLTPEVREKVPEVIERIMEHIERRG
jgi:hydrogenase maturation protease